MNEKHLLNTIPVALQIGYRLIDTATNYRNEIHIANRLSEIYLSSCLCRSDLFLTSKLQPKDHGYEKAKQAIQSSLEKLQTDYLDLYLIHWPGVAGLSPVDKRNKLLREGSWKALEEAYQQGLLRAIGVSNYSLHHLQEMESYACVMPMVNQIEIHPLCYPIDVITYCQMHNIVLQAYSSLGHGKFTKTIINRSELNNNMNNQSLNVKRDDNSDSVSNAHHNQCVTHTDKITRAINDSKINTEDNNHDNNNNFNDDDGNADVTNDLLMTLYDISNKYNISISQVLLKWALQKGFSVIPKSTNLLHIQENYTTMFEFEISLNDMILLDEYTRLCNCNVKYFSNHYQRFKIFWNPDVVL